MSPGLSELRIFWLRFIQAGGDHGVANNRKLPGPPAVAIARLTRGNICVWSWDISKCLRS